MKVRIREYQAKDENFIRDSFRRSLTRACNLSPEFVASGITTFLDRVLANPRTKVLVGVDAEDDQEILGYAMTTEDILHFVLVKRESRKAGLCRALLSTLPRLRAWWPHPNLDIVSRCATIHMEPTCLIEI